MFGRIGTNPWPQTHLLDPDVVEQELAFIEGATMSTNTTPDLDLDAQIEQELQGILGDVPRHIGDEELITMIRLIAQNDRSVDDGVDHIPGMVIARTIAALRDARAQVAEYETASCELWDRLMDEDVGKALDIVARMTGYEQEATDHDG